MTGANKKIWIVSALAIVGAFISRWHGGGFFKAPKIVKNVLWALPFGILSAIATNSVTSTKWWIPLIVFVLVTAWSAVFKATGHGGGMDLAHNPKEPGAGRDPEKLEYLILWLRGRIPGYWYDLILLTVIGLFSVAGAAFAIGWVNVAAGSVVALGGLGKPIAYAIGWAIYPAGQGKGPNDLDEATEIGELLTGFVAYAFLVTGFFMGV